MKILWAVSNTPEQKLVPDTNHHTAPCKRLPDCILWSELQLMKVVFADEAGYMGTWVQQETDGRGVVKLQMSRHLSH